jgi:hypothetical protein
MNSPAPLAVEAPKVLLAVSVAVAVSIRQGIAILIAPLSVADLHRAGEAIRIVIVAIVAAAVRRYMTVPISVRVAAIDTAVFVFIAR